jgi:hypothetical protein
LPALKLSLDHHTNELYNAFIIKRGLKLILV